MITYYVKYYQKIPRERGGNNQSNGAADTQLRATPSTDDHLKIYLRWCISDEVSNAVSMIVSISFLCCTYEAKENQINLT